MKYFKNTELAKLYNVSEKSVRNWIDAAQAGKLELQLEEVKGRFFVANTVKNTQLVEGLVEKGKKYKNRRGYRVITPAKEFYKLYDQKQVFDIMSNLTIHREIPALYTYADGGAKYWDDYANRLNSEESPNILTKTIELLDNAADSIKLLTSGSQKVNVVDLGPGNGLPIRSTLARLLEQGRLNRYIAIDGSKDMLRIVEKNMKDWFGDKLPCETYVRDFSHERFDDIFIQDYPDNESEAPINLVFILGGTLDNFRSPNLALQTINSSMGPNDLLIYSGYQDTPSTRRYFDYSASRTNQKYRSEILLSLLGMDESMYDLDLTYDEWKKARIGLLKFKVDLSVKFDLPKGTRYVELNKNEPVLIWRNVQKNVIDTIGLLDRNDFDLSYVAKSANKEYALVICKLKIGPTT